MMYFDPKTDLLEYQDGAYLCDGKHRVKGPLDLEALSQAVEVCPKLQMVALDQALRAAVPIFSAVLLL